MELLILGLAFVAGGISALVGMGVFIDWQIFGKGKAANAAQEISGARRGPVVSREELERALRCAEAAVASEGGHFRDDAVDARDALLAYSADPAETAPSNAYVPSKPVPIDQRMRIPANDPTFSKCSICTQIRAKLARAFDRTS
jgi:hypothetical protein